MSLATRLRQRLARATPPGSPSPAPRFVVRVVVISFATVVGVLGAISVVMVLETRAVVERGIASNLTAAQAQLAASQRDRGRDALLRASLISSSPTVKTVLESYQEQRDFGVDAVAQHELDALQRRDRAHRGSCCESDASRRGRPRRPRRRQRRSERARLAGRDRPPAHRRRRDGRVGPGDLRRRGAVSRHRRADRRGGRAAPGLSRRGAPPGRPLRRGARGRGPLRDRRARRRSADRQHVDRPGARHARGAPAPPRSPRG